MKDIIESFITSIKSDKEKLRMGLAKLEGAIEALEAIKSQLKEENKDEDKQDSKPKQQKKSKK